MRVLLLFACIMYCHFSWAQNQQELQAAYNLAKEAHTRKDYPAYYSAIKKALAIHPYHQGILYQTGIAAALNHHPEEAVEHLKAAILIDASYDLKNKELESLQSRKDFQELLSLQLQLNKPIVHSDTAFILKDRQLHTEGIGYSPSQKKFYLGSIHKRKIVAVDADGNVSDFTKEEQDGMSSVFGIRTDEVNKSLWTCTSPMPEMQHYDSTLSSAVYQFDLASGRLIKQYKAPNTYKGTVFGDLVLDNKGQVYISDSRNNIIFKVNEGDSVLQIFFQSKEIWNVQGLTFSNDYQYLFISDYIKGLFRLHLLSKELIPVKCKLDISLKGIDGLSFYKNSLITIQNGTSPLAVMRFYLNKDASEIIRYEVIDKKHPAFNEPTIGTLKGNEFYYIANSQWGGYENGVIKPASQLQEIVVLKSILK